MIEYTANPVDLPIGVQSQTRLEQTYAISAETVVITPIPYDASEHPAELNISGTAMAGTKSLYTVVNVANIDLTGSANSSQPIVGSIDVDLEQVTGILDGHKVLEATLSPITLVGTASIGIVGKLDTILKRIEGVLSGNQEIFGSINRTLRPLTLSAESESVNIIGSINGTLHPIILSTQMRGTTGLDWSINITLPKITLSATAHQDIHGSISAELAAIGAEIGIDSLTFEIIAMNLLNKAITNFTNYPFNSFCYFNGKYFGCARDGIYELTGVDDFGTDIASYVETGLLNLELKVLQRIRHAWLTFKSSGILTLTITTDDGVSYSYTTENITTNNQAQKVKFGKGFKDTYVKLKIANTDGCTFSIDTTRVFDEPVQHRKR